MSTAVPQSAYQSLVVFDYNWNGHVPSYHREIVEGLLRANFHVVSVTANPSSVTAHVQRRFSEGAGNLTAKTMAALGQSARMGAMRAFRGAPFAHAIWRRLRANAFLRTRHAARRWRSCTAALEQLRAEEISFDGLFLPFLDDMLSRGLDSRLLPNVDWAGIFMLSSDTRDARLRPLVDAKLRLLGTRRCRGVAVLDESSLCYLRARLPSETILVDIPDATDITPPASLPSICHEIRARAKNRNVVGLMGHISEQKNLGMFLRLARMPENRDLFFFFAGQVDAMTLSAPVRSALEHAISGEVENLFAQPGRIADDAEFNALFREIGIVFAAYRDFPGSSNILTKAGLSGKPIVVAEGYCMADRVRRYRLGLTVDPYNEAQCAAAIRALATNHAGMATAEFQQDFSLAAFHQRVGQFANACFTRRAM